MPEEFENSIELQIMQSKLNDLENRLNDIEWKVNNDNNLLNSSNDEVAGEAINASSTPQSVYKDSSDGKLYLTDANDSSSGHRRFYGFVDEGQFLDAGDKASAKVQGKVTGFSGLTKGSFLYLSDAAGAISHTPSTTATIRIAIAISDTEISIIPKGIKQIVGSVSKACNDSDQTTTVTLGWRPKLILVYSVLASNDSGSCNTDDTICSGAWSDSNGQGSVNSAVSYTAISTTKVAVAKAGAESTVDVTINNITDTSFDIVVDVQNRGVVGVGDIAQSDVFYVAIGE